MASRRYWPIWQITLSRLKEFLRAPGAVFWVYGFPIIMMLALGTAFRDNPKEQITVDMVSGSGFGVLASAAEGTGDRGQETAGPKSKIQNPKSESGESFGSIEEALRRDPRFTIKKPAASEWQKRLQSGKTDLVIEIDITSGPFSYRLWDEPHRTESRIARYAVELVLLRAQRSDMALPDVKHLEKPGSRYIDFLLPGMIGLGLMGGGLWGVGFVVVDMRVRKLLKRFLATPMRKSDFLLALICSRFLFTLADIAVLLVFGYFVFDVHCQGDYFTLTAAVLLGGAAFAGIGLLVASRADTLETVSGLMNLVMLPMWILSGVFFSSERFPEAVQPIINLLPLTALNQLLRGIILEGKSMIGLWPQAAILATYAATTFSLALRLFRWR